MFFKGYWWLDDAPLHKKSRQEDNSTTDTCTNNKNGGDAKDTAIPSDVFFRKASELKPLKRLNHNSDISTYFKRKDKSTGMKTLDHFIHKDSASSTKCSRLKLNTQTVCKDNHDRRRSGEGSSHGNHGNVSPGDPAGVKDVANVVVKYLSPYLKQGSIVSKVTSMTRLWFASAGFVPTQKKPREGWGKLGRTLAPPSHPTSHFVWLRCCIKQMNTLFVEYLYIPNKTRSLRVF